ncbi:MAG TPA: disulfide bond formation protein B [Candidatus Limnocylindrales bacterium]|nr:disulfide bond formation protein B [Candidatus Limnocylindrales bacterium]
MPEIAVETVERFYAILALLAIGFVVIVGGLRLLAIGSDRALDAYAALARAVQARALAVAWIVALLATGGSLYFSEVAGFTPCTLCWYQRIAMYPFVVLLGVAAVRRARSVTGAPALAAVGAAVSGYHVALEWVPSLDSGACAAAAPCTYVWFREFGIFSLPTLALTAFLLILTLLLVRDPDEVEDVAYR